MDGIRQKSNFPVDINLDTTGGYAGQVEVNINKNDSQSFETNFTGSDPTRFPARIKAAATALYECSCYGKFVISHNNGHMTIKQIKSSLTDRLLETMR